MAKRKFSSTNPTNAVQIGATIGQDRRQIANTAGGCERKRMQFKSSRNETRASSVLRRALSGSGSDSARRSLCASCALLCAVSCGARRASRRAAAALFTVNEWCTTTVQPNRTTAQWTAASSRRLRVQNARAAHTRTHYWYTRRIEAKRAKENSPTVCQLQH